MNIIWLGTPESCNPLRVGGKAAHLARLASRHPVPPGFCIPATYPSGMTHAFAGALTEAYRRLGLCCGNSAPAVAVRSSAVDEDGRQASFAGQHETYLNVSGAARVLDAVQECLQSAQSERAHHYRRSHGLDDGAPRIAVLIQQFIHADVSAVVFSADPCTGARDQIVINAVWGLGESLVGGSVTPDLYVVQKDGLGMLSVVIADKTLMTVPGADGTREVPVPRAMRHESSLTDDQVFSLARLALALEKSQGWAVDLECAFFKERLYLLQCRPITAI